jgi:hypothetical protein
VTYLQSLTYCHSIASSMLLNPSGQEFIRLFMWGRASTAEPNDKSSERKRIVQSAYNYPRQRLILPTTPAIRYLFWISPGQLQTATDPFILWPTSFEKLMNTKPLENKDKIFTTKVGQFDGSGKRIWSISERRCVLHSSPIYQQRQLKRRRTYL